MPKLFLMSCLVILGALTAPVNAVADCSTRMMAGDHALFMQWNNGETTGTIFAKAEIKANGRLVLRGVKVNYFETANPYAITEKDGYGAGSIGLAPLCTGVVSLTITDRTTTTKAIDLEARIMASGSASDPFVKGVASVNVFSPSVVPKYRNIFADLELRKIRM